MTLQEFTARWKEQYGDRFFLERTNDADGRAKVAVMTEKVAEMLRRALGIGAGESDIAVTSFENDNGLGEYAQVSRGAVAQLLNHPGLPESERITKGMAHLQLHVGTRATGGAQEYVNELMEGETVRVYQPAGHRGWLMTAVCHDFENVAPKALGWVEDGAPIERVAGRVMNRPAQLTALGDVAARLCGIPYRIGGKSAQSGFDCSSLTQSVLYATRGIWLPRQAAWQARACDSVSRENLRTGDLAFFSDVPDGRIEHVGIVMQPQGDRLPALFHTSRWVGGSAIEDLNAVSWLGDKMFLTGFGRVRARDAGQDSRV